MWGVEGTDQPALSWRSWNFLFGSTLLLLAKALVLHVAAVFGPTPLRCSGATPTPLSGKGRPSCQLLHDIPHPTHYIIQSIQSLTSVRLVGCRLRIERASLVLQAD